MMHQFSFRKGKTIVRHVLFSFLTVFLLMVTTVSIALPVQALESVNNSLYTPQNTYISPVKISPITFTGLGVSWHQKIPAKTSGQISIRFMDAKKWTQWYPLEADIDGVKAAEYEYPASFISANPTNTFQYKVLLQSQDLKQTPLIENIEFTYINSGENKKLIAPKETLVATLGATAQLSTQTKTTSTQLNKLDLKDVKIISRSEWGADESLRLYKGTNPEPILVKEENDFTEKFASELKITRTVDKDNSGALLTWPFQYPEKINKIVVHHTATIKDLTDPKKAIRDIYYWHAISRGWGDIGYNYIIDPEGNIYEGRAGGDGVVGGHAGKGNIGSIGIAVLGNYQENDVPEPVFKALAGLIKAKTKQYNIDPTGSSMFRGENMPNVMGHRDIMSTSCPGEKLFSVIPLIRTAAKSGLKANIINRGVNLPVNKKYDFSIQGEVPFPSFEPGGKQELSFQIKNAGPETWGAGTFFGLSKNDAAQKFLLVESLIKSNALTSEVKPGGVAAFKITVQAGFSSGLSALELFPMINGTTKVERYLSIPIQIKSPVYDFEVQKLTVPKNILKKGALVEANLAIKNTGNVTWKKEGNGKFNLGTDNPRDHVSKILQKNGTRIANLEEKEVAPGQVGHFKIKLKAPNVAGSYQEYFTPVIEGVSWFPSKDTHIDLVVYEKDYQGKLVDETTQTFNLKAGEKGRYTFQLQNIGGLAWLKNGAKKFTLTGKGALTVENASLKEEKVDPGKTATVSFDIKAPLKEGTYLLRLFPRIGTTNILSRQMMLNVVVGKQSGMKVQNPPNTVKTSVSPNTKPIRIDLGYKDSPVISANGNFTLESDGIAPTTFVKDEKISVTWQNNQYQIASSKKTFTSKNPPRFTSTNILRIDNWERRPSWSPGINDNEFRGVIEVRWYDGRLHTINELPLEDYLKGLGEIDEKQHPEKIRTIIILARTYANFYMNSAEKFPGAPFHLSDDPQTSQKYVGYSFEKRSPNTVKAVKDTLGMIVTYQGKLIKTPYFSSDDGRTRSAEEVWGWKDTPYLVSVPDDYCKGKTLNGHGVGLSGCGSLGMAQAGKTYEQIIKYYYKGVDITKIQNQK